MCTSIQTCMVFMETSVVLQRVKFQNSGLADVASCLLYLNRTRTATLRLNSNYTESFADSFTELSYFVANHLSLTEIEKETTVIMSYSYKIR